MKSTINDKDAKILSELAYLNLNEFARKGKQAQGQTIKDIFYNSNENVSKFM